MAIYFSKEEALAQAKETIENGFIGPISDLIHEAFNTDYYIVGTYTAEFALTEYGVFKAIKEVKEYELEMFGEVSTSLEDPEKLANMLYYIIGQTYTYEAIAEYEDITEENRDEIIEVLNKLL